MNEVAKKVYTNILEQLAALDLPSADRVFRRGGGKTQASVLMVAAAAFEDPGCVGLITASTPFWVQAWEWTVPAELYAYEDGGELGRRIELYNGAKLLLR